MDKENIVYHTHTHTHTHTHNGILLRHKKTEILPFAATCMGWDGITLLEISQKKTNASWYHLYMGSKKYNILVDITDTKQTQIYSRNERLPVRMEEEQHRGRGVGVQTPGWKAQGCIVQGREYSQHFVMTINEKQPLKIVIKEVLKDSRWESWIPETGQGIRNAIFSFSFWEITFLKKLLPW